MQRSSGKGGHTARNLPAQLKEIKLEESPWACSGAILGAGRRISGRETRVPPSRCSARRKAGSDMRKVVAVRAVRDSHTGEHKKVYKCSLGRCMRSRVVLGQCSDCKYVRGVRSSQAGEQR